MRQATVLEQLKKKEEDWVNITHNWNQDDRILNKTTDNFKLD